MRMEAWFFRNSSRLAIGIIIAAFVVRVVYAGSCFMNGDEAQHFIAARPDGWLETYKASHLLAHPPLFILVLHAVLILGRTELILRSPSLIAGTFALWLTFVWIRRCLSGIAALGGLVFMGLSPAAISAATEVRQYGLLLFFVCCSLYATERAFTERSTRWAMVQGLFLVAALLTHYTALVVIVSLAFYGLLRWILDRTLGRMMLTIIATQLIIAAVFGWLYFDHIRESPVFSSSSLFYLTPSFYLPGNETFLGFLWRALFGTFTHISTQKVALILMVGFGVGVVALLAGRTKALRPIAFLITVPFAVGLAAAVAHVFPFAGSRHQTYLLPFIAMGFSAALGLVKRHLAPVLLLVGAAAAPIWILRVPPDNGPWIQSVRDMSSAISYLHQEIPRGAPIFVDDQTRFILAYYLGRDDASLYIPSSGLDNGRIVGGYRLYEPSSYVWTFSPNEAFAQVNETARSMTLPPGTPIWIVSVYVDSFASQFPKESIRRAEEFGKISIIETAVDQPRSAAPPM